MSTKVVVRHFHEGNDANRKVRKGHSYSTVARIIDLDSGETVVHVDQHGIVRGLCEVWAHCSRGGNKTIDGVITYVPPDVPSRKQGRIIAVGRLQKQFPKECAEADFGVFAKLKVSS